MKYTFKDFESGKQRFTRGRFAGFTEKTGVRHAIFSRRWDDVLVPEYLLTPETLTAIVKVEEGE